MPPHAAVSRQRRVSLCETLDRVLNKGVVVAGDIIISVADIDIVYVGANLVVASMETMRQWQAAERAQPESAAMHGQDARMEPGTP